MGYACANPEGGGGQGVWTPLKNHKNIGFISNIGQGPLKNHKATKLGNHGPASETPFKRRFARGMARF